LSKPVLLQETEFIRSRQVSPIACRDFSRSGTRGDYADDVTPEELAASEAAYQDYLAGRDPGLSSKELKAELFGKKLERMGLHCPETQFVT